MNKIKRMFLWILQGKIVYDDKIVPVVIKDHWYDTTPSITIKGYNRDDKDCLRQQITVKRPLKEDHPLYDGENPEKKYPHLAERTRHTYEIEINVWCNDERQRDCIVKQVKHCLFLARNNHYTYCSKYDSETHECKTLGEECRSRTTGGYANMMGICPSPKEYRCCNIFNSFNVIKNTINISDDYEKDEYEHKPPLKRSIIQINLNYYDINVFPSNPTLCREVPQFEVGDDSNINRLIEKYYNG